MPVLSDNLLAEFTTVRPQQDLYDTTWNGLGSFGIRINRGRATKRFFILYSIGGKRRRYVLGDYPRLSVSEAKQKAVQVVEQIKRGVDPAGALGQLKTEGSFDEVAKRFLQRGSFSVRTLEEYTRIIKKELSPVFSTKLISQITEREVKAALFTIGEAKPTLANRVRGVLQGIFNFAFEAGLCDKNIVSEIRPNVRESKNRKQRGGNKVSLEILQKLYANAAELTPASKGLIKFTLLSGVSVRLVEQLTWSDLHGDYWTTSSSQTVFLTPSHRELINHHSKNELFLFSPDKGKTPFKNSRVTLQRIAKEFTQSFSWSDIISSIRYQMLKIGLNYSDLSLVYGLGVAGGLELPEMTQIQRSSKRVFTDWSQILDNQPLDRDGGSNVIRMRRLKRLK